MQQESDQTDAINSDQKYGVGHEAKTASSPTGPGTGTTTRDKNGVKWCHWNIRHSGRKYHGTCNTTGPGKHFSTETHTITGPIVFNILPRITCTNKNKIHYSHLHKNIA